MEENICCRQGIKHSDLQFLITPKEGGLAFSIDYRTGEEAESWKRV